MQFHDQVKVAEILVHVHESNDVRVVHIPEDIDLHRDHTELGVLCPAVDGDLVPKDKLDCHFLLIRIAGRRDHKAKTTRTELVAQSVFLDKLGDKRVVLQVSCRDCKVVLRSCVVNHWRGGWCNWVRCWDECCVWQDSHLCLKSEVGWLVGWRW